MVCYTAYAGNGGTVFSARALSLLGILELSEEVPTDPPLGVPTAVEQREHWRIEHFPKVAVWRCLCGRSDPLIVPRQDLGKVRLPNDLVKACEICRQEVEWARGKTGHLQAWLERHRQTIDPDRHLYLPGDMGYCRDREAQRSMKTRRFVYEAFWKKNLLSDDCVRSSCNDANCINPYHLCLTNKPAKKVSIAAETYIRRLAAQGISAKTTRLLLRERLSLELSLRSIQLIRADAEKSRSSLT